MTQNFAELSAEDRAQVERALEMLGRFFHMTTGRIKSYQGGDSSVFKLLQDVRCAALASAGLLDELIQRHGIPDAEALRSITEDGRSEWREMLTTVRGK